MQKTLLLIAIALCCASCISSKKIDKHVHRYYTENPIEEVNDPNWLVNSVTPIDTFSTSDRTKAMFVPGILYWHWHTNVNTKLTHDDVANRFIQYLTSKSDSLELPKLLKGQRIEFEFLEAPSGFSYIHKGNVIFLVLFYMTSDLIAIVPDEKAYQLKYRVLDDNGNLTKEGEINVDNTEVPMTNVWKSSRKFTWAYLDEYHKQQNLAFERLAIKIVLDLKRKDS